jgi:hypothetical protein
MHRYAGLAETKRKDWLTAALPRREEIVDGERGGNMKLRGGP